MKRRQAIVSALCLATLSLSAGFLVLSHAQRPAEAPRPQATVSIANPARVRAAYGQLPLSFEANSGQTDPRVKFLARGSGYTVFLTDRDATLRLNATDHRGEHAKSAVVKIGLTGANPAPQIVPAQLQPGHSNYLIGNQPDRWIRNVPHYAEITYREVYPRIDLVYHGNQRHLEQDFVLAPGADANQIDLKIAGAETLSLNAAGDLVVATGNGDLLLRHPTAYQELSGKTVAVAASFVPRKSHRVGIQVAAYDRAQPLIIDPVVDYATYLSGSGTDSASSIAVDSAGNAYITGGTNSTDFPTLGAMKTTLASTKGNAFVTKLNPSGSALVFSTYLGGSGDHGGLNGSFSDDGAGIAVDAAGNIYVAGTTGSSDFPLMNPYQATLTGVGAANFVTKLDPTGATVLYSSFLGGNGGEICHGLAVDAIGNMYITGVTSSTTYPITVATAIQTKNNSTDNAYVSRIDPTIVGIGSLVFSTYLGGSGTVIGDAIAVDSNANAYVTGQVTASSPNDFPVKNAFQSTLKGNGTGIFLSRIDTNPGTASLVYSTVFSGTTSASTGPNSPNIQDVGNGIDVDGNFNAFVAGTAGTPDFPTTPGAFQTTQAPAKATSLNTTAFVARFDTSKSGALSLLYSSLLGGSTQEFGAGIKVDSLGDAFVVGSTASHDFPIIGGAPQVVNNSSGAFNVFLSEFNPTGTGLFFSTYLGGQTSDQGSAVALDSNLSPNVFITGTTLSSNFPTTTGAFQINQKGTGTHLSSFVAKLSPAAVSGVFATPGSLGFGNQNVNTPSRSQSVTLTNATKSTVTITSIAIAGANAADFSQTNTCGASIAARATCVITVIFKPSGTGSESATLTITDSDASSPQVVQLSGTGISTAPDFSISITPAAISATAGSSATFTVSVAALNGFSGAVSLTCSGAPPASTCTLSPTSVTPTGTAAVTSTGTIKTSLRTIAPPIPAFPFRPNLPIRVLGPIALALALLSAWLLASRRASRKLAWSLAVLAALALSSCSGLHHGGTPTGSFTITVKGTSGSLTHSATATLTVN